MTNTPIGLGPNTHTMGVGQTADAKSVDALQFRAQDKGSTTAELLRGKIGQLRMISTERAESMQKPNFRELISPSAITVKLLGQLQTAA